jgi:hypothetical protein
MCYYQAPFCEKCEWDFIEEKPKKKLETIAPIAVEERRLLGYIPDWLKHPHFPWMDYNGDGAPDSLKRWGREFIDGCKKLIGQQVHGEFDVYRGVVEQWVTGMFCKNPVLRNAQYDFMTWFCSISRGITIHAHDESLKFFRVWVGTEEDARVAYKSIARIPEDWGKPVVAQEKKKVVKKS